MVLHSCCLFHSKKAFVIPLSASFEMSVSHHSFILLPFFYLMPCFTLSLTFHCNCQFITLHCFQIARQRSPSCHWSFHSAVLKPLSCFCCQTDCMTGSEKCCLLMLSLITLSAIVTHPLMPWSCCNFTSRLMQLDVVEYKIAILSNCLVKNEVHLLNEDFIMPPLYRKTKKFPGLRKSFFILRQRQVCCEYWFQLHTTWFAHSSCEMSNCSASEVIQLILIPRLSPDRWEWRRLNSIVVYRFNPPSLLRST